MTMGTIYGDYVAPAVTVSGAAGPWHIESRQQGITLCDKALTGTLSRMTLHVSLVECSRCMSLGAEVYGKDYYVAEDGNGDVVSFPADGRRVEYRGEEPWPGRLLGDHAEFLIHKGTTGVVISSVPEWHDTHVQIDSQDVWVDPCVLHVLPA